jgi:hypothetical protein
VADEWLCLGVFDGCFVVSHFSTPCEFVLFTRGVLVGLWVDGELVYGSMVMFSGRW